MVTGELPSLGAGGRAIGIGIGIGIGIVIVIGISTGAGGPCIIVPVLAQAHRRHLFWGSSDRGAQQKRARVALVGRYAGPRRVK